MLSEKTKGVPGDRDRVLVELPFLPSLHFVAQADRYNSVVLEQWEHYSKGSYRNKCVIHSNRKNQYLIIPLRKGKHQSQPIREVEISYDENWIRTMGQQLQTEYGSLPYFQFYIDDLMEIVRNRYTYLFELNIRLLLYIFKHAGVQDPNYSQSYETSPAPTTRDLRNYFNPAFYRKNPELMHEVQIGYFSFIPGHSIVEALFAYGPELVFLIPQYQKSLLP